MPCYLLVDPIGSYAAQLKTFLDRMELPALAIFSSPLRMAAWQHKWRHQLGEYVLETFLADDGCDLPKLAEELRQHSPDGFYGVVPWDELHILLSAEISEQLDLGWNPPHVVERCRNKFLMKSWLRQQGYPRINASQVVASADEAIEFQQQLDRWPIVVKPSGGAGSMKVFFADTPGTLLEACQQVLEFSMGQVLLEEYIAGEEFAVNGLVDRDGSFLVTDIWFYDKRSSHGIPNLYFQSIKVSSTDEPFWPLARYASEVIRSLELRRSPVHMEIKIDDQGPCLVEVGARFAGGDQPVLASKLHGRSLFELAACHYLEELPLTPKEVDYESYDQVHARIVSGVQIHELDRVHAVLGADEVESLPSFEGFGFLRPLGSRLPQTRDLDTKSYEVYLSHPDPDQVVEDSKIVRAVLKYL